MRFSRFFGVFLVFRSSGLMAGNNLSTTLNRKKQSAHTFQLQYFKYSSNTALFSWMNIVPIAGMSIDHVCGNFIR